MVCTPNGIVVQQSLKVHIKARLRKLVNTNADELPRKVRVKITVDGILIARSLNVINIAFTTLEEGQRTCSVSGNRMVAILKVPESYETLSAGLEDICEEIKNLKSIDIDGVVLNYILEETGNVWLLFVGWSRQCQPTRVFGASAPILNDGT